MSQYPPIHRLSAPKSHRVPLWGLVVCIATISVGCMNDVDNSNDDSPEFSELEANLTDTEQAAEPIDDDGLIDVEVDERIFAPADTNTNAAALRSTVDAAFDDDLDDLAMDNTSSVVLAERRRTCDVEGDCGSWDTEIPLKNSEYDTEGVFDEVDWERVFKRASARSIGRLLGRNIVNTDGEEQTDDGYEVVRTFRVSAASLDETIEDARETSYTAANERSWEHAEARAEELQQKDTDDIGVTLIFDDKFHSVSRHHVNWFDIESDDEIGTQIRAKQLQALADLHDQNKAEFESLERCEWNASLPSSNGATVTCSLEDLEALLDEPPQFVDGIEVTPDLIPATDGGEFRAEEASRLENYLDVATSDARTGAAQSPSGSDRVTVAYEDDEGFYKVDEHPAFDYMTCGVSGCSWESRVQDKQSCNDEFCWPNWSQGSRTSHGSRVIGALQSILDGQDGCGSRFSNFVTV